MTQLSSYMRNHYRISILIGIFLLVAFGFYGQAAKRSHQKALEACIEDLESLKKQTSSVEYIRVMPVHDANYYWGVKNSQGEIVVPFQYRYISNFVDGVAAFSNTKDNKNKKGFIDFTGRVLFEFKGARHNDEFSGFENGRTRVFLWETEVLPWGIFTEYGNPLGRVYGYVDCTGKVTFEKS